MKFDIIGLPKIHNRYVIAWLGEATAKFYFWASYNSKVLAEFKVKDLNRDDPFTTFVVIDTKEE